MRGAAGQAMALAIVLSYNRPQNIPRVIEGLLCSNQVSAVIVSNNHPDRVLPPIDDPRLQVICQGRRTPSALRFFLAAESGSSTFICIDDDLFLTSGQIDFLLYRLANDPSVPHGGPWGEKMRDDQTALDGGDYPDTRVDVLNRAYAFTKQHAQRFVQLAGFLGCPTPWDFGLWDDVVLSHCGDGLPRTHGLGWTESCPTSAAEGVACWKEPGFHEARMEILGRIRPVQQKLLALGW